MGLSCSQPCERCVLKKGTNKPLLSGHSSCLVQNPPCLAQEGQSTVGSDSKVMEVGTERESWVKGYTKEFQLVGCFDRHVPKGKYRVWCCGAPTADDQTLGLGWFETDSPALSPFV